MDAILHISVSDRDLPSLNKEVLGIKAKQSVVSRLFWVLYLLICCLFLSTRLNEWHGVMEHGQLDLGRLVPQSVMVRQANVNWKASSAAAPRHNLSTPKSKSTVITKG